MAMITHHYIDRQTGKVIGERLLGDRMVKLLYSEIRERAPQVFQAVTSARGSNLLGCLNYETLLGSRFKSARELLRSWGVDDGECLEEPEKLDTPAKLFMRKIKFWECRPMGSDPSEVVSPADSRVLLGSLEKSSLLYIKEKFFQFEELFGSAGEKWAGILAGGDFAVFRLTPDKYHYNHTPVAGRVADIYPVAGEYNSCNPEAVIQVITPFSKNKRVITIFDTDVPGGTGVGYVAMIEVAALMVGDIEQCYSWEKYDYPKPVKPGMFLEKGRPKSLFKPGGSTVILMFEPNRVEWEKDLMENQRRPQVTSRFSLGFQHPLVETDLKVRSPLGRSLKPIYGN